MVENVVVASSDKAYGEQVYCLMMRACRFKADIRMMFQKLHRFNCTGLSQDLWPSGLYYRCGNLYGGGDLNFQDYSQTIWNILNGKPLLLK